jgi:hypothetical protein
MFEFENATKANHGKYKQFIHGEFTDKLGPEFKKGACFALSSLFLSRFDKTQNTDEEIGPLKFTAATDHQKVIDLAKQVQSKENQRQATAKECGKKFAGYVNIVESRSKELGSIVEVQRFKQAARSLQEAESGPFSQEEAKAYAESFGALNTLFEDLRREALGAKEKMLELAVFLGNFKLGNMYLDALGAFGLKKNALTVDDAKWVLTDKIENTLTQNNGRYMLVFPKHAVAALVTDAKWKFFDANFGQGVFTNANDFKKFLRTYLDDGFIKDVYKLQNAKLALCATAI